MPLLYFLDLSLLDEHDHIQPDVSQAREGDVVLDKEQRPYRVVWYSIVRRFSTLRPMFGARSEADEVLAEWDGPNAWGSHAPRFPPDTDAQPFG